jgi:O-acetyl-ADP-ribose deacetylase (regulator of RNase III)
MKIIVKVGDVLTEIADVLISTANPWLNLSGGVNGTIREVVGPDLQSELHEFLKQKGLSAVPAGTVVRSNAYTLAFKHILHAVAIDPFYDSSSEIVGATFAKALDMALELQALTVSSPTLATGYGPMSISDFGSAVAPVLKKSSLENMTLKLVVRRDDDASELLEALCRAGVVVTLLPTDFIDTQWMDC